ncbi:MAG: diguanylate cyclase [Magnetococcales bacterium]|nr:diguanylate cyclase [Magnetococcales bacterium]
MTDKRGTILIVDDERFNIAVLKDLLNLEYDTMVAESGRQALERIASAELPDLILLDIMMPEMDGYYGHSAGDDCLKTVAQALAACLTRATDLVARYGGEEFACVLPETDSAGAVQFGEKIRHAISRLQIPHAYSKTGPHVTISLGVTTSIPSQAAKPEELICVADQNLYRAKDEGRNRLAFSILQAVTPHPPLS